MSAPTQESATLLGLFFPAQLPHKLAVVLQACTLPTPNDHTEMQQ